MKKGEKPKILGERKLEKTAVACTKFGACEGCLPKPGPTGTWES